MAHENPPANPDIEAICKVIKGHVMAPSPSADGTVELSAHMTALLQKAAAYSTTFPPDVREASSPNTSSEDEMLRAFARQGDAAYADYCFGRWQEFVEAGELLFGGLAAASRLPQKEVLDYFSSGAAAAEHAGWLEACAKKVLTYGERAWRSGSMSSSQASQQQQVWVCKVAPHLLHLLSCLQELQAQCSLAAERATATASSTSARSSAGGGGSRAGRRGGRGGRTKQGPADSKAAAPGGSTWNWAISTSANPLATALMLQSAWVRPSLVQLARELLRSAKANDHRALATTTMARNWVAMQLAPTLHPAMVQLGAHGPTATAAALAAARASSGVTEVVGLAWGFLASGSQVLRQVLLPQVVKACGKRKALPSMLRVCPRYHRSCSYAAGVTGQYSQHKLAFIQQCGLSEQRLVAAELWHLWPWQLAVLQQLEQGQHGTASTQQIGNSPQLTTMDDVPMLDQQRGESGIKHQGEQGAPTSASAAGAAAGSSVGSTHHPTTSSSSGGGGVGSGRSSTGTQPAATTNKSAAPPGRDAAGPRSGAGSSNSNNSQDHGLVDHGLMQQVFLPLLPQALALLPSGLPAAPTCPLPPVTQQQLQLALERVCATVGLSPQDTRSSMTLLVLLLLRAEPTMRLAFLQGPTGGLLLAALQQYACGRTWLHAGVEAAVPGLAPPDHIGALLSRNAGTLGLLDTFAPSVRFQVMDLATSAGLLLSWLLLQPLDDLHGPRSNSSMPAGSNSSSSGRKGAVSGPQAGVWTAGPSLLYSLSCNAAGGLPCIMGPAADLQLLPGYVPDLQLLATLETLHQASGFMSMPAAFFAALASVWEADPSKAPPPSSPMWLALASMAVGVRKAAAVSAATSTPLATLDTTVSSCCGDLLALLRLAAVAQQQPGAGWGAVVLGSAVQGAALACCGAAVHLAEQQLADMASGPALASMLEVLQPGRQGPMPTSILPVLQQGRPSGHFTKEAVLHAASSLTSLCGSGWCLGIEAPAHIAAIGKAFAAAAETTLAASPAASPAAAAAASSPLDSCLVNMLHLLSELRSSWLDRSPDVPIPFVFGVDHAATSRTPLTPTQSPVAAGLLELIDSHPTISCSANILDESWSVARTVLSCTARLVDVCHVAAQCARSCSSAVQLLGCAHLGCTTPTAGGLASCEAALVVNNHTGGVCGGCGVVRYCSAACAQRDWPHHRRVCRRLAAARAARATVQQDGSK